MADSAFGVDHGEFSKAFPKMGMPKIGGGMRRGPAGPGSGMAGTRQAGARKAPGAVAQFAGGAKQGLKGFTGPMKPPGTLRPADQGLRFGQGARNNAGKIGLGVAGAGAGTAGGMAYKNRSK